MSSQPQSLATLEALLREACQICDDIGLDLAAIRIEEALLAVVSDPEINDARWRDPLGTLGAVN